MNHSVLYLATSVGPILIRPAGERWQALQPLVLGATADEDSIHACIACDPRRQERVFYALPENGVWRSDDAGGHWRQVFRDLPHKRVTAVTVSANGTVYVGTEPSALFASEDGGETWERREEMEKLPSAKSWSFPPRPESHHVRWIQPHPTVPENLHVAIEAGALVTSPDGGRTWRDAIVQSPYDTHQMTIHPEHPRQLWSAAGDGIYRSLDGGESWQKWEHGLRSRYGWSIALDPADPQTAVLSAAHGPSEAHWLPTADAGMFRRGGESDWEKISDGLPKTKGSLAAVISSHAAEPGVFYAGINSAVYRSTDAGKSWRELPVDWPPGFSIERIHAIVAASVQPTSAPQ